MFHRFLVLCFLLPFPVLAQTPTRSAFELGAVVGGTTGASFGPDRNCLGLRFGYTGDSGGENRTTMTFSLEAEVDYLSGANAPSTRVGDQAIQGMFGIKFGPRGRKNGFMLKLRPGFLSFAGALSPTPGATRRLTLPLIDSGVVYERYFSRHWAMRVDLGFPYVFYPGTDILGRSSQGSVDNGQLTAGLTYRF